METPQDETDKNETNGLENEGASLEFSSGGNKSDMTGAPQAGPSETPAVGKQSPGNRLRSLISHVNIYLLLFILIIILAAGVTFVSIQKSRKESAASTTGTQTLTQDTLNQLNNSESKVGDARQTLNVQSNAVFSGKVLVRDSLDVAGGLKLGGNLSLPGISVSGTSTFDNVQLNNLAVAGSATLQGQLSIQKGLTVAGGASFGGPISAPQITISTLQINNDLQFNRHLDAGGNSPGKSDGTALGIGGTSSVSGTDTAGTININTGGNPPAGCFITVNFSQHFNSTPHVVVSPVGSAAAGLNYYINRSTANFSLCTTNPAPAGTNFSFDFVAID